MKRYGYYCATCQTKATWFPFQETAREVWKYYPAIAALESAKQEFMVRIAGYDEDEELSPSRFLSIHRAHDLLLCDQYGSTYDSLLVPSQVNPLLSGTPKETAQRLYRFIFGVTYLPQIDKLEDNAGRVLARLRELCEAPDFFTTKRILQSAEKTDEELVKTGKSLYKYVTSVEYGNDEYFDDLSPDQLLRKLITVVQKAELSVEQIESWSPTAEPPKINRYELEEKAILHAIRHLAVENLHIVSKINFLKSYVNRYNGYWASCTIDGEPQHIFAVSTDDGWFIEQANGDVISH
jgi:hypothetical protein